MEGNLFFFTWEVLLITAIQGLMEKLGHWSVTLASGVTMLGEETVLIAVMGFVYWCYDKEAGKRFATAIVTGLVWNPLVKNIVLRRRPYFVHPEIKCLKVVDSHYDMYDISGQGFSFPSGHSSNTAIVYGGMPLYVRRNKGTILIAIVLPLLVGISRFALGVHYPTDVIAGWAIGLAVVFFVRFLQKKMKRAHLHILLFAISCAGFFYCRTTDYFTCIGVMAGLFLAIPFEERFVRFENTRKWHFRILRLVGGFVVYFGVNILLKLPSSSEFLGSATMAAFLVRTVRYAIVSFIAIGVYPMIFAKIEK